MSLIIGKKYIQICPECGWKSNYIQHSDVVHHWYEKCPECQSKLVLKEEKSWLEQLAWLFKEDK